MARQSSLYDKYELAIIYCNFGDYTNMQSTIDYISGNFEMSDEMLSDFNGFQTIMNSAKLLQQNNSYEGSLTEEQKQELELILTNDRPLIGSMALALLKRDNYNYIYNEEVYDKAENSARLAHQSEIILNKSKDLDFKLYPNPAVTYTTLFYRSTNDNIKYSVSDMSGKIVLSHNLETIEGRHYNEILVDLQDLSVGTYQFTVLSDSGIDWSYKLVIVK